MCISALIDVLQKEQQRYGDVEVEAYVDGDYGEYRGTIELAYLTDEGLLRLNAVPKDYTS